MVRVFLLSAGLVALVACADAPEQEVVEIREPMAFGGDADEGDAIVLSGSRVSRSEAAPAEQEPGQQQLLAYSYHTTLEAPGEIVPDLMAKHRDACHAAGAAVCQVVSARVFGRDPEAPSASLRFRAIPSFVASYREGLSTELKATDGRILEESQEIEDLTRNILDSRARLDGQIALRDRLLTLLERPTDDVGDLLQVERELARVQSEIESMTSQLRYLEGRVSMNRMDVSYQSKRKAFTPRKVKPLRDAISGFFENVAWSLANLIEFFANALPWIIVGLPTLWGLLRLVKMWRR